MIKQVKKPAVIEDPKCEFLRQELARIRTAKHKPASQHDELQFFKEQNKKCYEGSIADIDEGSRITQAAAARKYNEIKTRSHKFKYPTQRHMQVYDH